MDINKVRNVLKNYIDLSAIISPPIFNYELDRLQKRIDMFFNCISETLFPSTKSYSKYQEFIRQEMEDFQLELEEAFSHAEENEQDENLQEEAPSAEDAKIHTFNMNALNEFMAYLGQVLYSPVRYYSPLSYRHPINLIELSGFFEHWNKIVERCGNSRPHFLKAKKDVEEYYKLMGKAESQRKQRMRSLADNIVIIVASVSLSAVVTYLMKLVNLG